MHEPLGGGPQFERIREHQSGLEVLVDLGECLSDGALNGERGVVLQQLVVEGDQRPVEREAHRRRTGPTGGRRAGCGRADRQPGTEQEAGAQE